MQLYLKKIKLVQVLEYDGTNNYEVCAFAGFDNITIYNEVGEVKIQDKVLTPGMLIIKDQFGKVKVATPEELIKYYEPLEIDGTNIQQEIHDCVPGWMAYIQRLAKIMLK